MESSAVEQSTGTQQQLLTGETTTRESASGELIEWTGSDKSEMALKRIAEKIVNFDMTPVAQALARHLGIDLSSDGMQARNRRGIAARRRIAGRGR